ncbi:unnamed protein product [Periconia digitata]|uniref:Zn(2)-C6 fungal-type domain-containing protein n=1 Tax=Periconia digitata TaxID=1303443 RepID=A0A9W4UN51_9PLEO|nr:unnamed protein product [Periconia digitata]
MEFDTGHRYSQNAASGYRPHYYCNPRSNPLSTRHGARPDPRAYTGGPVGGRLRPSMNQEIAHVEGGQSRRRIAVACARCRKRKIRCSGDPGDGTGCLNCRQANVSSDMCQFHRVGSGEPSRAIDQYNLAQGLQALSNAPVTMMQMYGGVREGVYQQPPHSQLEARPLYAPTWDVPFAGNTSPVETYGLESPATYLPHQQAGSTSDSYANSYRWSERSRPAPVNAYAEHDSIPAFSTTGLSLPYPAANLRNVAASSEALSPLNMGSLQLSLPDRTLPERQSTESNATQRQLPIPQPSPAQKTRNIVDQLQDQRLRSIQGPPDSNASGNGFTQPPLMYHNDGDIPSTSSTESSIGAASVPCSGGSGMSFVSSGPIDDITATTMGTQHQLNFSTSNLLDGMPTATAPTAYSNFRNYNLSLSNDSKPVVRKSSPTNVYSYSVNESSRHRRGGDSNDGTLVSGHRYTPLTPSQPRHRASLEDTMRRSSHDTLSSERTTLTSLNRTC